MALDPARNSLNFLRLVLASMVLFSHAYYVGKFGNEDVLHGSTLGEVAVYGFFGISGYLIAGSALRNGAGRYLWQRSLRIMPGFWMAIILTAFAFGWVGWASQHRGGGYFVGAEGPVDYVWRNWLLRIVQSTIHGTGWNGSLWTLFYEALCYLLLLGLALLGALRRPLIALVVAVGIWLAVVGITLTPGQANHFNVYENWVWMNLLRFASVFLLGAVIHLYRNRIPDSGWLALGCATVFTAALWLPTGGHLTSYYFTDPGLMAPLITLPLLWLGAHLPFQRVGGVNDYSYGVYVYAYPVTVLLQIWGAASLGYVPFALLCVLGTAPFAAASWWLIERPALSLKKLDAQAISERVLGPKPTRQMEVVPTSPEDPVTATAETRKPRGSD